jgi:predicted RecA/RadA family phage recombinase
MADHTPLFKPGQEVTLTASATITGGQVVIVSGDETVAPAAGASAAAVGVAKYDAASGAKVGVVFGGVHELTSTGAIAAGDPVTSAAGGVVAAYSGTTFSTIIGKALKAAASNKVIVRLF